MNQSRVNPNEDFNILSTITAYNNNHKRLIEVPIMLNYINIYSPDGSFGKTVCMEEKIDNISDIQLFNRHERRKTFGSLCVYDNMFGVLCGDNKKGEKSIIRFFDMDGEPLIEFKLDRITTTFDIDFKGGSLYIHNYETEDFYKYDITQYFND